MNKFTTGSVAGFKVVSPILIGILPFAIIVGVTGVKSGLTALEVTAMSLMVFAGTSQLASFELISTDASLLVTIFTGMVINIRFLMYSASIAPYFQHFRVWQMLPLAYFLTDQVYAVSITSFPGIRDRGYLSGFYIASGLGMWVTWQGGTIIGTIFGQSIPPSLSLKFAIPLTFMAIMMPVIRKMPMLVSAITSGIVAVLGHGLPYNMGLVIAAITGIGLGMVLENLKKEQE